MTADIQTLNFITHKLERLPLGDALVSENLPKLFCFHGINDVKGIYPRGLKAGLVTNSAPHRNATPSNLADWAYEGENVHSFLKRTRVECQDSFCLATDSSSDYVLGKFLPLKKKRSSEAATSQENIDVPLEDDEEVTLLCRKDSSLRSQTNQKGERECQSRPTLINAHERSLFKPVARRPRSRPSVGLTEMKVKSMWNGSPHKNNTADREVKLIKVPHYTNAGDETLAVLRKDFCFRPIVRSGVFEAFEDR